MEKKKTDLPDPIHKLADILSERGGNVFAEAHRLGIDTSAKGEDGESIIWERLRKECSLFKCEMCDVWMHTSNMHEDDDREGFVCEDCMN